MISSHFWSCLITSQFHHGFDPDLVKLQFHRVFDPVPIALRFHVFDPAKIASRLHDAFDSVLIISQSHSTLSTSWLYHVFDPVPIMSIFIKFFNPPTPTKATSGFHDEFWSRSCPDHVTISSRCHTVNSFHLLCLVVCITKMLLYPVTRNAFNSPLPPPPVPPLVFNFFFFLLGCVCCWLCCVQFCEPAFFLWFGVFVWN